MSELQEQRYALKVCVKMDKSSTTTTNIELQRAFGNAFMSEGAFVSGIRTFKMV